MTILALIALLTLCTAWLIWAKQIQAWDKPWPAPLTPPEKVFRDAIQLEADFASEWLDMPSCAKRVAKMEDAICYPILHSTRPAMQGMVHCGNGIWSVVAPDKSTGPR